MQYATSFLTLTLCYLIFSILFSSCSYTTPETFLIPQGYKGSIYIIYNQVNGQNEEYENGRRLYKIPVTGVLFTKFKNEEGIINQQYYYVTATGQRTRLGILDTRDFNEKWTVEKNPHEPPRDSLAIFNPATVGIIGNSSDIDHLTFQSTFVGTYNDIKNAPDFPDGYIDSLRKQLPKKGM